MTIRCCSLATAFDTLLLAERMPNRALLAITFGADRAALLALLPADQRAAVVWDDGAASPARTQLQEYFAGQRRTFELLLAPRGTPFQREVWAALADIGFGATCSYGDIAARIGRPRAVRAVGGANGKNPIPVVVPCHRVIGSDGSLTGYGGGLPRKQWLLAHEGVPRMAGARRS